MEKGEKNNSHWGHKETKFLLAMWRQDEILKFGGRAMSERELDKQSKYIIISYVSARPPSASSASASGISRTERYKG